jgi:membrane protease YdiL (CAAX protease family)
LTSGAARRRRLYLLAETFSITALTWGLSLLLVEFNAGTFAVAPLLYIPLLVLLYRREPWADWGLTLAGAGRGLGLTLLVVVVVFPLFALGYHAYRAVSGSVDPGSLGAPFGWIGWLAHAPGAWRWVIDTLSWELLFVALPEEFFYRGYLQGRLRALFADEWRAAGLAIVLSAACFAAHHYLLLQAPERLMVFFPALVFGWLRHASGSIVAPVCFHAACNLFAALMTKAPP